MYYHLSESHNLAFFMNLKMRVSVISKLNEVVVLRNTDVYIFMSTAPL